MKTSLEQNDHRTSQQAPTPEFEEIETMDDSDEKKLLRRIDLCILPILALMSGLNFLDRSTLGISATMGLIQDLNLTGTEYSWANSIFYFGYFAFTWFASYLLVRFPIAKTLAVSLMFWGLFIGLTAACKNFAGLAVVRILLGCAEATLLPGSSLITSMWYKREEHPLRIGAWFLGTSIGVMCSGVLTYGIAHIKGGIGPWRWLYIIFALITLGIAVITLLFLPDCPDNARFLNPKQKTQAVDRVRVHQQGVRDSKFKWYQAREALLDLKVWLPGFTACALSVTNGALNAFTPIILVSFGFDPLQTYLFYIAIGGVHASFTISASYICTRFRNKRCYTLLLLLSTSLMGSLLVRLTHSKGSRLFGFFCYYAFVPALVISLSLITSNTAGFTKRSVGSSLFTIAYSIGNIIGPFTFRTEDAPEYRPGHNGVIGCFVASLVFVSVLLVIIKRENRNRARLYGEVTTIAEHSNSLAPALADQTDYENHDFRYVY